MSLRCPSCRLELHAAAVPGGGVSLCHGCAGAWLDTAHSIGLTRGIVSADFKRAMVRAEAEAIRIGEAAAGYRAANGRAAPADDATRLCAECDAPLSRATVKESQIATDACPAHGTWFDAGELLALAYHFESKAVRDDADVRAYAESIEKARERAGLLDVVIALVEYARRPEPR